MKKPRSPGAAYPGRKAAAACGDAPSHPGGAAHRARWRAVAQISDNKLSAVAGGHAILALDELWPCVVLSEARFLELAGAAFDPKAESGKLHEYRKKGIIWKSGPWR